MSELGIETLPSEPPLTLHPNTQPTNTQPTTNRDAPRSLSAIVIGLLGLFALRCIRTKRMSNLPTYRPVSLLGIVPQLVAVASSVAIAYSFLGYPNGVGVGALVYLIYSFGSRFFLVSDHRRGMRQFRRQEYAAAIESFRRSYEFLSRYPWLDEYRAVFLMSAAALQYREMALCNIAACYLQLGNGPQALVWYRRAIAEFPNCGMAHSALKVCEAFQVVPAETV